MTTSTEADRFALPGHLLLFACLYGGYGALSPFLPAFLQARGLSAEEISVFLAAAMVVRLAAGPLAGRWADRRRAARPLLAVFLAAASGSVLAMLAGYWAGPLLLIGLLHAVATAPLAPLADALALSAAAGGRRVRYGLVRAAGSAAFIAATVATGRAVEAVGLSSGLWACALLFAAGALATLALAPARPDPARRCHRERPEGIFALLALPRFRRMMLSAALVIGAHAMHDAFAVIVWTGAGVSPATAALLWSEAVAAEVLVFLALGPWLLARLGPGRALALAAAAGALRWGAQAQTVSPPALAAIQLLHGLTFALLHLACLALIEATVPPRARATAITLYGTLALGLASALATAAAGNLYARFGMGAFWAMSAVSLAAVPLALSLPVAEDEVHPYMN